ncbi:hypothetical protein AXF42_Ash003340 [Apostasia shenzhenica]|uniref:Uncharacterized protein n=1 Tax=Apostasia shenzhenica TaxID=1088818 RepID=A0A2I0BFW4_9ASPA|nr:hypothetical protein AXF42_Ash003340 [Apostasia shenzhenica]
MISKSDHLTITPKLALNNLLVIKKVHKKADRFLNVPILEYDWLEAVCGEGHATSRWARDSNQSFASMKDHGKDNSTDTPFDLDINMEESSHVATEENNNEIGGSSHFTTKERTKKRYRDIAYRSSKLECMNQIANDLQKLSSAIDTNGYRDNLLTNIYQELHTINGINDDEIEHCFDYFASSDLAITSSFMIRSKSAKAKFVRDFLCQSPSF